MHDAEPSLTEMWGALESLTGTQNEKGDLTVGRTVQLFRDRDDARQVANHIRVRRNSTIHAARSVVLEVRGELTVLADQGEQRSLSLGVSLHGFDNDAMEHRF